MSYKARTHCRPHSQSQGGGRGGGISTKNQKPSNALRLLITIRRQIQIKQIATCARAQPQLPTQVTPHPTPSFPPPPIPLPALSACAARTAVVAVVTAAACLYVLLYIFPLLLVPIALRGRYAALQQLCVVSSSCLF
jgi:hypothetical protein